ncbi:hypothetical protein RF11_11415 [Thelohanellus kitauei]|uniref:Uncharacterized protein n=1 Tax=Thelohanellus kitauei TaxID=669202 RepID=A0A0C2J4A7_THEKT|nr:hypothetical protein RF11_11415 [Thelohanellus kitauei]
MVGWFQKLSSYHDPSTNCDDETQICTSGSLARECMGNKYDGRYVMNAYANYFGGKFANTFSRCSIQQMESIFFEKSRTRCLKSEPSKNFDSNLIMKQFSNSPELNEKKSIIVHRKTSENMDSITEYSSMRTTNDMMKKPFSKIQTESKDCESVGAKRCEITADTTCLIRCILNGKCLPLHLAEDSPIFKPPGSLCNDGKGFCLTNHECKQPISSIFRLNEIPAQNSQYAWFYDKLYIFQFLILGFIFIAIARIFHVNQKNPSNISDDYDDNISGS